MRIFNTLKDSLIRQVITIRHYLMFSGSELFPHFSQKFSFKLPDIHLLLTLLLCKIYWCISVYKIIKENVFWLLLK